MSNSDKPSRLRHNEEREVLFKDLADLRTKVEPGKYAVMGDDGTMAFFRIHRPKYGRSAGLTLITRLDGEDGPERVRGMRTERDVLSVIAVDPEAAAQRYEDDIAAGTSLA